MTFIQGKVGELLWLQDKLLSHKLARNLLVLVITVAVISLLLAFCCPLGICLWDYTCKCKLKKQVVGPNVLDIDASDGKGAESNFRMWVQNKNNKT